MASLCVEPVCENLGRAGHFEGGDTLSERTCFKAGGGGTVLYTGRKRAGRKRISPRRSGHPMCVDARGRRSWPFEDGGGRLE